MMRKLKLIIVLFLLVGNTGCWNMRESDQLAFIIGSGIDYSKEAGLEISSQIAIPTRLGVGDGSGGGSSQKSYFVVSAAGKNFMDASKNLQSKLSRSLFYAHRQTILIGQGMAEHGIGDYTDMIVRNPRSEIRSTIVVVKDAQAKEMLNIESEFDPYISTTFASEQAVVGLKPYDFRHFLSDSLSLGKQPLLPAFKISPDKKYVYDGAAVLNNLASLKLVGFLNVIESCYAYWMTGKLNDFTVTSRISEGEGIVSLKLQKLRRRIRVKTDEEGRISIDVRLSGVGTVVENNSKMDPNRMEDLRIIQNELNRATHDSIRLLVEKIQKKYKTDIFGFGEIIHRQHPQKWTSIKQRWSEMFPEVPISVEVELEIEDMGLSNGAMKPS